MAPYTSQWELIERKAHEKGIAIDTVSGCRGYFLDGAAQVYPRASKDAQQYLAELWTWNRFFRSGDVFPGRDPIYDDLVAALNSVESMAASINYSSSPSTACTPRTATSIEQANLETETILMRAQLDRQQTEITSLKDRVKAKESVILGKNKAQKAKEEALESREKAWKGQEQLLADTQKKNRNLAQQNRNIENALRARNENIKKLCALNDELRAQISHHSRAKHNLELEHRDEGAKRFKKETGY